MVIAVGVEQSSFVVTQSHLVTKLSNAVGRVRAGRPARPRPTALLPPRSNGKAKAATAVVELLMMGVRTPETC